MMTSKNNRSLVCLRAVALLFGTFFFAVLPVRAENNWTYYAAASKNQDKNCTIYCSKRMGWKELASPLEGDYESVLAPEGCFGVLVDASGNRRAWMVHRASPYDKSGLAIFVR